MLIHFGDFNELVSKSEKILNVVWWEVITIIDGIWAESKFKLWTHISSTCGAFCGGIREKWEFFMLQHAIDQKNGTNLINARVFCLSKYTSWVILVPFSKNFAIPWTSLQK